MGLWESYSERCNAPAQLQTAGLAEAAWKGPPQKVKALYAKGRQLCLWPPEYCGAREISQESRRPTSKG